MSLKRSIVIMALASLAIPASARHGLHRFQIVVWTLVFTVIFVARVFVHLAMPDFDSQLLALMGISSGTYIGFKFPEKQA